MNRYRLAITEGPITTQFECDAESKDGARAIAEQEHPGCKVGYPFLLNLMREVPSNRSSNSRYHLADVDKMGADGAPPLRFGR